MLLFLHLNCFARRSRRSGSSQLAECNRKQASISARMRLLRLYGLQMPGLYENGFYFILKMTKVPKCLKFTINQFAGVESHRHF